MLRRFWITIASCLFLLLLSSCLTVLPKGVEVEIVNNSDQKISDLLIYTSQNQDTIKIERLLSGEMYVRFLSMNKETNDGHYIVQFDRPDGSRTIQRSGYYFNGTPATPSLIIKISNDTGVIFEERLRGEY